MKVAHSTCVRLIALSLVVLATACKGSEFGGGGDKKNGTIAPSGGNGDANPNKPDGGADGDDGASGGGGKDGLDLSPPDDATPEQNAIGKCLAAWGKGGHPFNKSVYDDFREIHAAVTVFGGGGYAVEDTEVTDGPKLILVHAAVGVLGDNNYLLMNPNGYYCFMVGVNVMAKSKIDLHCKAKLTDNKVNVNVGSNASATSAVGVNVFSDVKVNRKCE